ncbi:hypothetical protein JCM10212_006285 [Sporobolomyces blumeae]
MSSGRTLSTPGTDRRYVGAGPVARGRGLSRGVKLAIALGLLAAVLIAVIPPAVVVPRRNKSEAAEQNDAIGFTTVVDGVTTFIQTKTQDVVTRTALSTLANGEVSTVTSAVTIPVITVSRTSLNAIQTELVTTTIAGKVVVLATATSTIIGAQAQVVTRTLSEGADRVVTVIQTDYDDTTLIIGDLDGFVLVHTAHNQHLIDFASCNDHQRLDERFEPDQDDFDSELDLFLSLLGSARDDYLDDHDRHQHDVSVGSPPVVDYFDGCHDELCSGAELFFVFNHELDRRSNHDHDHRLRSGSPDLCRRLWRHFDHKFRSDFDVDIHENGRAADHIDCRRDFVHLYDFARLDDFPRRRQLNHERILDVESLNDPELLVDLDRANRDVEQQLSLHSGSTGPDRRMSRTDSDFLVLVETDCDVDHRNPNRRVNDDLSHDIANDGSLSFSSHFLDDRGDVPAYRTLDIDDLDINEAAIRVDLFVLVSYNVNFDTIAAGKSRRTDEDCNSYRECVSVDDQVGSIDLIVIIGDILDDIFGISGPSGLDVFTVSDDDCRRRQRGIHVLHNDDKSDDDYNS